MNFVQIEPLDINRDDRAAYHGVSYSCPTCHTVLSVGIDPIALKREIIEQLRENADHISAGLPSQDEEEEAKRILVHG